MPMKSVKMKISKKSVFFSGPKDYSTQNLGSKAKKWAMQPADRQTDRQTHTQTVGQTDRHTDRGASSDLMLQEDVELKQPPVPLALGHAHSLVTLHLELTEWKVLRQSDGQGHTDLSHLVGGADLSHRWPCFDCEIL